MLNQFYSKQFKKDVVKSIKRGNDPENCSTIM
jgi:hypothetical protein